MAHQDETEGIPTDPAWLSPAPRPAPRNPLPPVAAEPVAFAQPPVRRARPRGGVGPFGILLTALLAGLVGGLAGGYAVGRDAPRAGGPTVTEALPVLGGDSASAGSSSVSQIARVALPSVVFISVEGDEGSGVGSGFVIREDGYIVTNNHVIEAAAEGEEEITVEFTDGESVPRRGGRR